MAASVSGSQWLGCGLEAHPRDAFSTGGNNRCMRGQLWALGIAAGVGRVGTECTGWALGLGRPPASTALLAEDLCLTDLNNDICAFLIHLALDFLQAHSCDVVLECPLPVQ